jgi:hypothetical protein
MDLYGTYSGIVEDNKDPRQLGRLKVRVPLVYGPANSGIIPAQDLPWAMPAGMPAGKDSQSGGMMWIPGVNDRVWVRFLDGEPEKPVWEWGMQDIESHSKYQGYLVYQSGSGKDKGSPQSKTLLTRYGHSLEINPFGEIIKTSKGYGIIITDASTVPDGSIFITTQKGSYISIDDSTQSTQIMGEFFTSYFRFDSTNFAKTFVFETNPLTGATTAPSLSGVTYEESSSIPSFPFGVQLKSEKIILGSTRSRPVYVPNPIGGPPILASPEVGKLDPIVRLSDFKRYSESMNIWLDTLYEWLLAHTHSNGNQGSPTGPFIIPPMFPANQLIDLWLEESRVPTGSPIVFAVQSV